MTFNIEINNVYGKIVNNLTIDQLAVIQQECQFKVEGSEYKAMAFKNRRKGKYEWDGYRKLFNIQTRRFPIGLLPKIRRLLEYNGIGVNIINNRMVNSGNATIVLHHSNDPRPYQHDAIVKSVMNGNGIIKVATGGGKTFIAARTIHALQERTIFIVHTRDLLHQAKSVFEYMFGTTIGQIGDGIIDYRDITVATMQTLAILGNVEIGSNKYDEDGDTTEEKIEIDSERHNEFNKYRSTVQCVMMDEVQIVCSQTAYGVRFLFEHANHAFGYSASPWRDDGSDLMIEAAFGDRIVDVTASELIRDGYLVRPYIIVKKPNYSITSNKGDYNTIYKRYIVENLPRNIQVANDAMEYYNMGLNTLILVTQIRHGEILQEAMSALGIPAMFISGKSSMGRRKRAIQDMRDGKIQIMIASTIADVGLDIPRLGCIVEAGAGQSSVTALQRLGRIMRPFDHKDKCYFVTYRDIAPFINGHISRKIKIWETEREFNIVEVD
jgi:superfamily II DNA or RNA helicase